MDNLVLKIVTHQKHHDVTSHMRGIFKSTPRRPAPSSRSQAEHIPQGPCGKYVLSNANHKTHLRRKKVHAVVDTVSHATRTQPAHNLIANVRDW